jgi:voltage-gated sodium channel
MLKLIFSEKNLFAVTLLNVVIIYFHSFNYFTDYYFYFDLIDASFTLFFVLEIIYKISNNSDKGLKNKFRYYWNHDHWNKLDFISVVLALPSLGVLFMNDLELFAGFTILRSLRIFKFIRVIEFIPEGKRIVPQLIKALKAVMFIIIAFIIYSTIISLISVSLYKSYTEDFFSNAFSSFFTVFKIFSGDGFSDVVTEITENPKCSLAFAYFTKFYFVFIVFTGSILGLSLINSIFIDQMTHANDAHNADEKREFTQLKSEIEDLKKQNQEILNLLNANNKKD